MPPGLVWAHLAVWGLGSIRGFRVFRVFWVFRVLRVFWGF